jgi:hypothetical protein
MEKIMSAYNVVRFGLTKFEIQGPNLNPDWIPDRFVHHGPLYAAYQVAAILSNNAAACRRRLAIKRQLHLAGIEVPAHAIDDLHALRSIRRILA